MGNIAVLIDLFFKNHFLNLLNGKIKQYNLNDITIWSLRWDKTKKEVRIHYSLHQDSLTAYDALEVQRIENKKRATPKERKWMSNHHAQCNFIIINVDTQKEFEALKEFCHENKIRMRRYNKPKSYNINWW